MPNIKDQVKRLVKSTTIYGLGMVLTSFINLLLLPFLTAYLTPKDYGSFSILLLLSLALNYIFMLGMGTSIGLCYFDNSDAKHKSKVIFNAILILILSSTIMLIVGLPFTKEFSLFLLNDARYVYPVFLTFISTACAMITIPFMLRLQFEEREAEFVAKTFASLIISVIGNIILIIVFKRGLNGLAEGLLITKIAALLIFGFSSIKDLEFIPEFNIQKKLVKLGIPMIPSFLALYVLQQGNIYILKSFTSLELAGIFSVGMAFGRGISLITFAFTTAWTPFFLSFANNKDEAKILFGRISTYYLYTIGFISILFFIFAKPVVYLFTQDSFHEAYKVIGLVTTGQMLIGIFALLLPPIYFAKKVGQLTSLQIIASAGSVVSAMILTPIIGIVGAGISFALGYFLMALLLYIWNITAGKKHLVIHYEWRRVLPFSIFYIVVATIIFIVEDLFTIPVQLVLGLFLIIPSVILIIFLLSPSERNILVSIIKNVLMGKTITYGNLINRIREKN